MKVRTGRRFADSLTRRFGGGRAHGGAAARGALTRDGSASSRRAPPGATAGRRVEFTRAAATFVGSRGASRSSLTRARAAPVASAAPRRRRRLEVTAPIHRAPRPSCGRVTPRLRRDGSTRQRPARAPRRGSDARCGSGARRRSAGRHALSLDAEYDRVRRAASARRRRRRVGRAVPPWRRTAAASWKAQRRRASQHMQCGGGVAERRARCCIYEAIRRTSEATGDGPDGVTRRRRCAAVVARGGSYLSELLADLTRRGGEPVAPAARSHPRALTARAAARTRTLRGLTDRRAQHTSVQLHGRTAAAANRRAPSERAAGVGGGTRCRGARGARALAAPPPRGRVVELGAELRRRRPRAALGGAAATFTASPTICSSRCDATSRPTSRARDAAAPLFATAPR